MYPELQKYKNVNELKDLEVVNFGTGFGYHDFCYDGLHLSAFNFSLTQQFLEYDYKLLKHYSIKFKSGCKICLVMPYFIFSVNEIYSVRHIKERYYSILPRAEVESDCIISYEDYIKRIHGDIYSENVPKLELTNILPLIYSFIYIYSLVRHNFNLIVLKTQAVLFLILQSYIDCQ